MFMKYAGMTMEERDPLVAEWANTIRVEEAPAASTPKPLIFHARTQGNGSSHHSFHQIRLVGEVSRHSRGG